jgi:potassium inwardly-rectifying channel subfamily J
MAGIVFAKFTKPTMRAETILFSKNALITMRNGSFYLICRVADLRYRSTAGVQLSHSFLSCLPKKSLEPINKHQNSY